MRNTVRNIVITGALVLAPVLAASPTMAAAQNDATQAPNQKMINFNTCGSNFYTILQGGELNQQSLSDLLKKLGLDIKLPTVTVPDANVPDNSKPESSKPESSKPETNKPETNKPEVNKPETNKPETNKPETNKPETNKPSQPPVNNGSDNTDKGDKDSFAAQVVNLVNQERAKAGLQPLKSDAALTNVAMIKAKDMYNNNYFDHNSPTLGSPFDLMTSQGIQYRTAGENIAKGQRTPEEVMNAWMNSAGHRQNILSANYTTIGVAYYNGVWVQEFIG
ncbi:CAP domain-containing protein [Paenibacillus segetis]|uniref:SCP domain-containing protein n=1 Tax=Paenibacillus segetis TaxID=1325360 RepID=A0ABQ1YS47_9BACL|nr:CAP domain-containing protein [Paenibacillus segetis]GGH36732.1 hypothetical protein GCM10008013_43790 [Paenibacillus segetis]